MSGLGGGVGQRPIRVLSIDGGGIRGLIPAIVLGFLENAIGRPIADIFDVVAGTSTGGILALGLCAPNAQGAPAYTAFELADLYPHWGKQIFPSGGAPTWRERLIGRGGNLWESMGIAARNVGAPFGGNPQFGGAARHSPTGLEQVLQHYFGDVRLSQALTEVVVTSYDSISGSPFLFSRRDAAADPGLDFQMRYAARATSAAPTFFPPQVIKIEGLTWQPELIDGGVWANNPSVVAFHEAIRLATQRGLTGTSVQLVSLGTGAADPQGKFGKDSSWLGTFKNAAAIAMDTSVDDFLMSRTFDLPGARRYWRFQTFGAEVAGHMDDPTQARLEALVDAAVAMLHEDASDFQQLVATLRA